MLIDSPGDFARKTYDFVIIGGGTAGLTLAARLTENPRVTVGVIEAGKNRLADPNLLVPGLDLNAVGNPDYDWGFKSTPQKSLNGRIVSQPRGKVLGGSSAINGMMCTYASKEDIDNWEKLGNPGWSHADLAPYFKKFESFTEPSEDIAKFYHTDEVIDKHLHNGGGPVKTSFPPNKRVGGNAWVKTFDKMGLKMDADPQSGFGNGGYSNLNTIDAASGTRSYAATAYYQPNVGRPNLTVLTDAQVNKITFDRHHEHIHASGVDFTSLGREYHVEAEHEILLCAGSFQSPQILELSGIGSKSILEKLEIDCIVDNPNVGENLQDHGFVPLSFQAAEGITTYDSITNNLDAAKEEYFANRSGLLTALFNSNANLSYEQVASRTEHISSEPIADSVKAAVIDAIPSLKKQYKLLGESLLNPENSSYQIIYIPIGTQKGFVGGEAPPSPGNFITIDISIERPYSRGRVHISSKDPAVAPKIDPNYLSHPLDLEIFRNGLFFVQDLAKTEPFSNFLKDDGNAFHPGFFHLTRENIDQFCREALTSEFHPLGTCSMMPERDGGVVDTHLRVYGVRGLRVVDASVMPMEIRNNIQSAVYAVAEKAADIIKADWKEKFGDGEELRNGAKRGLEYESEGRQNGKRSRRY